MSDKLTIGHVVPAPGSGPIFTEPIRIWVAPVDCPACGSDQTLRIDTGRRSRGMCDDCGHVWELEQPSPTAEGENDE